MGLARPIHFERRTGCTSRPDGSTLYLRGTTMRALGGEFDRILHFLRETMIPVTEVQEGFCGGGLISDRRANKIITLSWWNSPEKMQASAARTSRRRSQASSSTLRSSPN